MTEQLAFVLLFDLRAEGGHPRYDIGQTKVLERSVLCKPCIECPNQPKA